MKVGERVKVVPEKKNTLMPNKPRSVRTTVRIKKRTTYEEHFVDYINKIHLRYKHFEDFPL